MKIALRCQLNHKLLQHGLSKLRNGLGSALEIWDGGHSGPDTSGPGRSGPLSPRGLNVLFTGLKVLTLDIQAPYIICYIFSLYYSLILFIIYPHEKHVGLQIADKEIIILA
jgi:hypothetical protein